MRPAGLPASVENASPVPHQAPARRDPRVARALPRWAALALLAIAVPLSGAAAPAARGTEPNAPPPATNRGTSSRAAGGDPCRSSRSPAELDYAACRKRANEQRATARSEHDASCRALRQTCGTDRSCRQTVDQECRAESAVWDALAAEVLAGCTASRDATVAMCQAEAAASASAAAGTRPAPASTGREASPTTGGSAAAAPTSPQAGNSAADAPTPAAEERATPSPAYDWRNDLYWSRPRPRPSSPPEDWRILPYWYWLRPPRGGARGAGDARLCAAVAQDRWTACRSRATQERNAALAQVYSERTARLKACQSHCVGEVRKWYEEETRKLHLLHAEELRVCDRRHEVELARCKNATSPDPGPGTPPNGPPIGR